MRDDEGKHVRFGMRVNSRAPVAIRWSEDDRQATAQAKTIDVSSSGCFVVSPQPIPVGQRVRLTNLVNGKECDAEIVRHGQQADSSWELGLKLESPSDEFWGLEF
jgi:hypothetical protein